MLQRDVIFGNRSGRGGGIVSSGGNPGLVHPESSMVAQNTPSNCAPSGASAHGQVRRQGSVRRML
jgi:hypothetical protein